MEAILAGPGPPPHAPMVRWSGEPHRRHALAASLSQRLNRYPEASLDFSGYGRPSALSAPAPPLARASAEGT